MAISCITLNECTGCSACFNICPQKAINMQPDILGFLYPEIDEVKCVECNLCVKKCPQNIDSSPKTKPIQVLACTSKEDSTVMSSSSGGAFFEICKLFFQTYSQCSVYGAIFEDGVVKHERVNSIDEVEKLKKSKYTQSNLNDTFKNIRTDLKSSFPVLFVGTPCQVDGLRNYLKNVDTRYLLTVDLLCTGVCSPLLFGNHCKYIEQKYKACISKYDMRYKQNVNGKWHIMDVQIKCGGYLEEDENVRDLFIQTFRHHIAFRQSCYKCKYTNTSRCGDITLGDYWKPLPGMTDNESRGVSVVISNTDVGDKIVESLKHTMDYFTTTIYDIKEQQPALNHPVNKPRYFVPKDINRVETSVSFMKKYGRDPFKIRMLVFLSHHIPNSLSTLLKKYYYLLQSK